MKTVRPSIIVLTALALLALSLTVWFLKVRNDTSHQAKEEIEGTDALAQTSHPAEPHVSARAANESKQANRATDATVAQPTEEAQNLGRIQVATEAKNMPINFWGKVVDQSEQPVSGVQITMRVRQWHYDSTNGPSTLSPERKTITDELGDFDWTGSSGDSLSLLSITKDGYQLSPKATLGFVFNNNADSFQPSITDPVIIHMWKSAATEKLVCNRTLFGFVPDGRSYTINLLDDKKTEGENLDGDIRVKIKRPATINDGKKYDWSFELDGINGGFAEVTDQFGFWAPEAGYHPTVNIQMSATDIKWTDSPTKDIFVRSRNGAVYGFLHLRVRSEYNGNSAIFFETRINPSGSRNLQP